MRICHERPGGSDSRDPFATEMSLLSQMGCYANLTQLNSFMHFDRGAGQLYGVFKGTLQVIYGNSEFGITKVKRTAYPWSGFIQSQKEVTCIGAVEAACPEPCQGP